MKRFLTKKTMMDAPRPSGCERISATRTHIIITTMRMLISKSWYEFPLERELMIC